MADDTGEIVRSRSLTFWGLGATSIFLILAGLYVAPKWSAIISLAPNEFGDLLAGVCSPLAFLWLVLGFLQQGQELRASVKALELQGEELRNSVEQQRNLVELTREELDFQVRRLEQEDEEAERKISPKFEIQNLGSSVENRDNFTNFHFSIVNFGHQVTKLRLSIGGAPPFLQRMAFGSGDHANFAMEFENTGLNEVAVQISYINQRGRACLAFWTIGAEHGASFARETGEHVDQ